MSTQTNRLLTLNADGTTSRVNPADTIALDSPVQLGSELAVAETGVPVAVAGFGTLFIGDGTGGTVAGDLYTISTAGTSPSTPVNITQGATAGEGSRDVNVVRVSTDPAPGDFSSVNAALASITDNSSTKLYVISVAPGIYTTTTITMKPYVLVIGSYASVLVNTGGANSNLILGTYDSSLFNVTLVQNPGVGAHGSGYAVYYDGAGSSAGQSFQISTVRFARCSNLVKVDGSVNPAYLIGASLTWGGTASFGSGFEVIGGNYGYLNVRSCTTVSGTLAAPYPSFLFKTHGMNAILRLNSLSLSTGTTGAAGTKAFWSYDAATIRTTAVTIDGWEKGFYTEAVGAAPRVETAGTTIRNCTQDIQMDHPGTTGAFNGLASHAKTTSASPDFVWLYLDLDDGSVEIRNSLAITYDDGVHTEVLSLFQSQGVGVVSGGVLSDGGGFVVSVAEGYGYYINTVLHRQDWAATSITLSANVFKYIYFDATGTLAANAAEPDFGTTLLLGRVGTNGTGIQFIDNLPHKTTYLSNQLAEHIQQVFGTLFAFGSTTSAGSSANKVSITGGSFWAAGANFTPSGGSDISFDKYYQSATPGSWVIIAGANTVPSDLYDDGSGTLAAIPAGRWVKHLLYLVGAGVDERYFLVYAQAHYADQATAETSPLPTPPTYFIDSIVRVASFVIQQGSAAITTFLSERPLATAQASASAAVSSHTALTNLTTGDAGHTQFDMLNGSTPRAANMDLGGFEITNVGNVDGVDVSAHATRHLPLGADPLTTAAPLIAVSASTANSVGTADSLARSDHQHAFDATTVVKQTITDGVTTTAPSENAVFDALALKLDANVAIVGATKTKVTYDADGLVTAGADATTADIADAADKRYVTDAQIVVIGNTSGTNSGDNAANSSTTHVGTTTIALNRASAAQALTGITSIDGSAATLTTARTINGVSFDGSADIVVTAEPTAHATTHLPGGTDALTTAAAGAIAIGDSAAVGSANSLSRSDHKHSLAAPAAPATVGTANATGASTAPSRADHVHAHGAQTDGSLHAAAVAAGTSGFMTGADKSKLDGVAVGAAALTSSAPADVTKSAASVGVAATAARADHKHDVSTGSPSALVYGGAGSDGVSTSLARADHVHALAAAPGSLVSYTQVVGTTAGPTQNTSSYALLSEMTVTLTPTSATNYIEVDFSGSFSNSHANRGAFIAIFVDGVQAGSTERFSVSSVASVLFVLCTRKMFQLSVASHTITIQWKRDANTATAVGVERILTVKEITA